MNRKKKVILLSGILLVIIFPCLCFIFFDQIMSIGLMIRSYQSQGPFTENQFDLYFSRNGKKIFRGETEFIGSTKDNTYGCQFKIPSNVFNMCLTESGFNIIQDEANKRHLFENITRYAQKSGLISYSQYKSNVYNKSGIFIKDTSDLYIRGPVYIFATDYMDDVLLVTICFVRI